MTDRYPDDLMRFVDLDDDDAVDDIDEPDPSNSLTAEYETRDHLPPSPRPRVTHLVLVDGLPADHWVDESADGSWSHPGQLGAPRRGRPAAHPNVLDPPHARELRWLDCLVGGREYLMALDSAPLVTPPSVRLPQALHDQEARVGAIRDACAQHASSVFHDPEMPAATHHTLETVLHADPASLTRSDRDDTAIGAILWVAGHANGHIGPTGEVLARELWARTGVPSSAASRGATMLQRLRSAYPGSAEPWPDSLAPLGAPRLKPTAHSALLTSSTRALLISRRDAALVAAGH